MKLVTTVIISPPESPFRLSDKIVLLGSCFADNIAGKLADAGFSICCNPFGTLYNPESIRNAVRRLDSGGLFSAADCVEMGAGAGRICSFEHHSSFARLTADEFLSNANEKLQDAREFWKQADRVIMTLGSSFVWYAGGRAVANCLKLPAFEFTRRMLEISEIESSLKEIIAAHPEKRFTITVSPVRHLGDGAHANTLSKARLLLGTAALTDPAAAPATLLAHTHADYFPAFEIMMDELRDYRFCADDLVHPSTAAVQYIWERFLESFVAPEDLRQIAENEKAARHSAHRKIL